MTLSLQPIAAAELDEFLNCFRERYVQERMQADHFSREEAEEFVSAQWQATLPQGIATRGHHLLWAVDPATAVRIGLAWVFVSEVQRQAFLYQIEVFQPCRSRGNGRQLLLAAEELAKQAGAKSIALNVFAANERAIAIYEAAGYATVSRGMTKVLGR
jgi:ribosomal protein S18 acetylase RimI-like enzyme